MCDSCCVVVIVIEKQSCTLHMVGAGADTTPGNQLTEGAMPLNRMGNNQLTYLSPHFIMTLQNSYPFLLHSVVPLSRTPSRHAIFKWKPLQEKEWRQTKKLPVSFSGKELHHDITSRLTKRRGILWQWFCALLNSP